MQSPERQKKNSFQQLSPTSRGNFSKCGKLIDQVFYIQPKNINNILKNIEIQYNEKKQLKKSTIAFTSVSRQKKPNCRFSVIQNNGQFKLQPNYLFGKCQSPTWTFPKKQKYPNDKLKQYQICPKHPLAKYQNKSHQIILMNNKIQSHKHHNNKYNNITINTTKNNNKNSKNIITKKDQPIKKKSLSISQTLADGQRNYSIILPRKVSVVDFFSKSKIKNPLYLSKQQVVNGEQSLQTLKTIQKKPKGYVQFFKKQAHQPIKVVKGFQAYLLNYSDQKQFNNYQITKFPTQPALTSNFNKQLYRNFQINDTHGPNLQQINVNYTKINTNHVYLHTNKFINTIKTRYDRAQPQPSTRLNYDIEVPKLGKNVKMEKMLSRAQNLFPAVNPLVKKQGDNEMMQQLKLSINKKQINQAMNPISYDKLLY